MTTTVASGGTLEINNVSIGGELLDVQGTGVGGRGAVVGMGGTSGAATGAVTLAGGTTIGVDAGSTLNLSGVVSGARALTKILGGALTLSGGANAYSGLTTVSDGTLNLSKTTGVAIAGALTIGNGLGGQDVDKVNLTGSNQIADTAAVTIAAGGVLELNANTDTIASLNMDAGLATQAKVAATGGGATTGLTIAGTGVGCVPA